MRVIEVIRRSGVGVEPSRTVQEAAEIMGDSGVGALAVIDGTRLVGIVTDRDLVRRALARGLPSNARVDDVMSAPAVSVPWDADISEVFALLDTHGVRRVAVTQQGQFVGMVTVDDLLIHVAGDLARLARPVRAEINHPHRDSPVVALP